MKSKILTLLVLVNAALLSSCFMGVADRVEDRWDRREGRWDRREDRWDGTRYGGLDRMEDRWDRRENVRDKFRGRRWL